MKTVKKIPMRTCVVTKTVHPKKDLVRIVANKEGLVFVDTKGKANGRGVYIHLSVENIELAKKSKALDRKLEVTIPDSVYEELAKLL
ncbi:RNase P modulator RnpM [Acholeplasma laidlawii]|uniref:RNase P modulator RnpM n=1 Tax=Acholeplasma laidlawii TaxID=2148 RepID=UPI002540834B|nr:YlxR family protein [Acholeplasma laidlawii]